MPKVSVIMPSYNHEAFVAESVSSVLSQTYDDLELVVTDDASADSTADMISEFNDPRIKLFRNARNLGASAALNNCLQHTDGEYVAVINSDDAWEESKLEKQVAFLEENSKFGAVFTKAYFVDESGINLTPLDYKSYFVFEVRNRSRFDWLNRFFYLGNCLCHPSVLIRRDCFENIGFYNERMANVPDLDMWVRLSLQYSIHLLDEKLVRFRILRDDANASGDTAETRIRGRFEYKQILDNYSSVQDSSTALQIFPEAKEFGEMDDQSIPYFLGLLALRIPNSTGQLWGLETLYNVLGDTGLSDHLEEKYGFQHVDFYRLTGNYDAFNIRPSFDQNLRLILSRARRSPIKELAVRAIRILERITQ